MSRWATHRSDTTPRLGDRPDGVTPPGRASPTAVRRAGSGRRPDRADAAEAEGARRVLVEVPGAPADVRPAVVDRGRHAASAVAERHLRAARQRLVGDAVAGVE